MMLPSRPTQVLAMVLHHLEMCILTDQTKSVVVKNGNMMGIWYLTTSVSSYT